MEEDYKAGFQLALAQVEDEIILDATEIEQPDIVFSAAKHLEADMDGWDYVVAASAAAISAFISTNADIEKWLAGVHDAANKQSGSYDFIQTALGKVFEHSGDVMDWFRTRDAEIRPDALFHRIFWGHDPLSIGPDNPFILMFENNGVGGIFQAVRHLLADTFSKQGLPIPGHSFFETKGDRPGNHLIDLVRELSNERYGNKLQAEAIYEHLLTIRAQDFAGGMVAAAIVSKYLDARKISDKVRISQVKLIAYSMSFYAEAIVGATRQNGIPYINTPLGCAMAKEFASLMLASNKKTFLLGRETKRLHGRKGDLITQHDQIRALLDDEHYLTI